ncbi:hypothetical protein ZIOFF_064771 [Zingiber officinale]|uniref:Uncharacterized protein n=1 Tax=Zingiber officinale TaxID=94328 RepID=A0A8J5EZL7_ZINOF|nr:hypothetical protein ZIOFF_064771 [Zingiber officinale]
MEEAMEERLLGSPLRVGDQGEQPPFGRLGVSDTSSLNVAAFTATVAAIVCASPKDFRGGPPGVAHLDYLPRLLGSVSATDSLGDHSTTSHSSRATANNHPCNVIVATQPSTVSPHHIDNTPMKPTNVSIDAPPLYVVTPCVGCLHFAFVLTCLAKSTVAAVDSGSVFEPLTVYAGYVLADLASSVFH